MGRLLSRPIGCRAESRGARDFVRTGASVYRARAQCRCTKPARCFEFHIRPSPALAARSVPPVPLVRYVGAWTYPTIGAHYHGMQPESADLVVRDQNGQASGTLSARFRLPAGSTENPVVRFDFTGAFGNSRVQRFAITASSGVTGTLELIPGPAFNLLEVNFNIDDKPGTIHQGNFLLIKQ